jgi:hypothetical protein
MNTTIANHDPGPDTDATAQSAFTSEEGRADPKVPKSRIPSSRSD